MVSSVVVVISWIVDDVASNSVVVVDSNSVLVVVDIVIRTSSITCVVDPICAVEFKTTKARIRKIILAYSNLLR